MNDRELLERVIGGKPVDRVPVGFWFHFLPDEETGSGIFDPTVLERNIEGHRQYIEGFKPDLVKIMSDGYFTHPLAGGAREIKDIGDLNLIEAIGPEHPWVRDQVKLVKAVTRMKPDTFYFYNVFSATTTLRFMVGRERLVEWLGRDEAATLAAIDRINAGLKALSIAVIGEGGADGVYFSVQNPDIKSVSDWYYQARVSPGERDILAAAQRIGGRNILHICGYEGIKNNFFIYQTYEAAIYSWAANVEGLPLGQGREFFGQATVLGGFPNTKGSILETGDRQEIEEFTEAILAESGRLGVIVGADCTIPKGIPYERLAWVREAARRAAVAK
ncbi:MAG: uroporphyrinogen decarboxylase [Deltaproteobacteria bacterium]|jgi:uroporphyrinogen decarboxylase|nr:uroporphyrinogen decarboxylase [Deltaproteobacteria bacterium]